jgi:uncharacterized membrane protein YvlD (DUF360 family)
MTNWEMFFGIAGMYILLLGIFVHDFVVSRRLMEMNRIILENTKAINSFWKIVEEKSE